MVRAAKRTSSAMLRGTCVPLGSVNMFDEARAGRMDSTVSMFTVSGS